MAASEGFKHESVQDTESIGRYLQALIEGFAAGRLELGADGQTLLLQPRGLVELEIKARQKAGRSKVTLRFSWREERRRDETARDPKDELRIRSTP